MPGIVIRMVDNMIRILNPFPGIVDDPMYSNGSDFSTSLQINQMMSGFVNLMR